MEHFLEERVEISKCEVFAVCKNRFLRNRKLETIMRAVRGEKILTS
jgi:hypothetical protein